MSPVKGFFGDDSSPYQYYGKLQYGVGRRLLGRTAPGTEFTVIQTKNVLKWSLTLQFTIGRLAAVLNLNLL